MNKSICIKTTQKWLLYSLCLFLILVTNIGCGTPKQVTSTQFSLNQSCYLSRYKGQTNKYFSSRIIVNSNYITNLQILGVDGLPPGVILNDKRGVLEGTPSKAGFYNISVRYNDLYKGTPNYGVTGEWTKNFEISIYDKLN